MQSALSSLGRNSPRAPAPSRHDITRPVTFYQASSTTEEVSPYKSLSSAFSHLRMLLIYVPVVQRFKVEMVFPFTVGMWKTGFRCPNSLFQFVSASWLLLYDAWSLTEAQLWGWPLFLCRSDLRRFWFGVLVFTRTNLPFWETVSIYGIWGELNLI